MSDDKIIVVEENVSLEPYLKHDSSFEAQLEKMGFEVTEEKPRLKIGYLAAMERSSEDR